VPSAPGQGALEPRALSDLAELSGKACKGAGDPEGGDCAHRMAAKGFGQSTAISNESDSMGKRRQYRFMLAPKSISDSSCEYQDRKSARSFGQQRAECGNETGRGEQKHRGSDHLLSRREITIRGRM